MRCAICGKGDGTIVARNGQPPLHAEWKWCLKRLTDERDRYKDALYHIGYRGADAVPTALEGLGDREPSHA